MKSVRSLFQYSALALMVCANTNSFASGFALEEQNAVQTGDFGAGGAAIAEDASTAWYNPAGLIRLDKPEVVLAGNEIWFNTKFNGTVNQSVAGFGSTGPVSVNDAKGGTSNFVPTFHAAYPINQTLTAGFSVTTPFGLATDYGTNTNIRYATTETTLKTIDISPSLGIKINQAFAVGFGVDEERLLGNFDIYGGVPAVNTSFDSPNTNSVSDWATGWHSGVLYQPTDTTRFGLSYHSRIIHHASGSSELTGFFAGNSSYYLDDTTTTINLPAKTELSAYHDMNNRFAIMGSVSYTEWSVLNNITLNNVAGPGRIPGSVTIPENFKNTWRVSAGTNYKINDQWLIRTGIGYDQNPTNNTDRNLILPDGDRYGVSVGGRFQASKNLALDAGYTHEFIKNAIINNTTVAGAQSTLVSGTSTNSANVLGLQMTYRFA